MALDTILFIAGIIITGVQALIAWVFKMIFGKMKENADNHAELSKRFEGHRLHASETYATKEDMNKGFDRVMSKLDKIDDKLDKKADK